MSFAADSDGMTPFIPVVYLSVPCGRCAAERHLLSFHRLTKDMAVA